MEILKTITVDKRSKISPQDQIFMFLFKHILSHDLNYHEVLPAPDALAKHLDVAIFEVEHAYHLLSIHKFIDLVDDQYIVTYIEIENLLLSSMMTINDSIKALHKTPSMKLVYAKKIQPDQSFFDRSSYLTNESIYEVKRIFYADAKVIGVMSNYISLTRFPDFIKHYSEERTLYELFSSAYKLHMTRSNRILKAISLSPSEAALLNDKPHTATFKTFSKLYDQYHRMISYAEFITSNDFAYTFKINI